MHPRRTSLCRWQCCGFLLCFSTLRRYMLEILSALSLSVQMLFFVVQLLLCSIVFFGFASSSMCAAASRAHDVCSPRIDVLSCAQESVYCCRVELHALSSISLSTVICAQENPRSTTIQYVTKLLRSAESRLLVRCTTIFQELKQSSERRSASTFSPRLYFASGNVVWSFDPWNMRVSCSAIIAQTYTFRNLLTNLGPFCGSMFLALFPELPSQYFDRIVL
jgi:hypothetical protein